MADEPDFLHDYGATPYSYIGFSGVDYIDALISNYKWRDSDLTWSTPDSSLDFSSTYPDADVFTPNILNTFSQVNALQKTAISYWLAQFDSVSGITFTELDGTGLSADKEATIRFANSLDPSTAYAYFPWYDESAGDVWFGSDTRDPSLANYSWVTTGHELGHALGLEHGHEGAHDLPFATDSLEYSIMTYTNFVGDTSGYAAYGNWDAPQTLMMYDIAALQYMYGADYTTEATDTVYTFDTNTGEMSINGLGQGTPGANRVFRTVWDGDGTDTYDLSNYTTRLSIDLRPGQHSDFDVGGNFQRADLGYYEARQTYMARGHLFNALLHASDQRSLIENAIGGSNDDLITGNVGDNHLSGGSGNDSLLGGDGNDTLAGGFGNDSLQGEDGDDHFTLANETGTDTLDGGNGSDWLDASAITKSVQIDLAQGTYTTQNGQGTASNVENAHGGTVADTLTGDENANILVGFQGKDSLMGAAGDDELQGGSQNDQLFGGSGRDSIHGGAHDDTLYGGDGYDRLWGQGNNDHLNGGAGGDRLWGDAGSDILNGGKGFDLLYGGLGNDTLYGNDGGDKLWGGSGNDQLFGGNGNDQLTGGSGDDQLLGGAGNDVINGTSGNNTVKGNQGDDTLNGGASADLVIGGEGADVIISDGGSQTQLTGGRGHDTFVFHNAYNTSIITDFSANNAEKIDLSRITEIADFTDLITNHSFASTEGDFVINGGLLAVRLVGVSYDDLVNGIGGYTADDFLF